MVTTSKNILNESGKGFHSISPNKPYDEDDEDEDKKRNFHEKRSNALIISTGKNTTISNGHITTNMSNNVSYNGNDNHKQCRHAKEVKSVTDPSIPNNQQPQDEEDIITADTLPEPFTKQITVLKTTSQDKHHGMQNVAEEPDIIPITKQKKLEENDTLRHQSIDDDDHAFQLSLSRESSMSPPFPYQALPMHHHEGGSGTHDGHQINTDSSGRHQKANF